jgi:undecaprenyl-diphosphatase
MGLVQGVTKKTAMHKLDYRIGQLVLSIPKKYRPFMIGVSSLGEPLIVIAVGLVGYIGAVHKNDAAAERAFVYAGIAYALNTLLKQVLRRARPANLQIMTLGIKSYSFPSGHAFGTVIFYGLFAYLDYVRLAYPWDIIIVSLIGLLVFFIGVSRVYLKTHYPSDVLAGWILGLLSLYIIIKLVF